MSEVLSYLPIVVLVALVFVPAILVAVLKRLDTRWEKRSLAKALALTGTRINRKGR